MHYATYTAARDGLVRDLPDGHEDQRGVSNTSTFIWADDEAVLVDTLLTIDENDRLIEWIRHRDKHLSAVYITHGHGDHAFGVGQLREAFPDARFLATAATIANLRKQAAPAMRDGFWERLFPGKIPVPVLPDPVESTSFPVGRKQAHIVETGTTDSPDTTVLWMPHAGVLAAGDVVYNNTYPYLSTTTAQTRLSWIAALERVKALHPTWVVCAHKDATRPDSASDIDATIQYLRDVAEVEREASNAIDFYHRMLERQPGRRNIGSLWGAATAILTTSEESPGAR
ncbi:MBL fold metallo-hydrolase [Microbacterium sp. I2]|jgi:glyoxylase-like metal-dependent hydrolase (beta-lactamase superfamily II)|uniref:MBL fold metallo-hydrolase n=1 Tax=Microbacterium terregens TaxID=69363 RepID=A0ABV5T419_9MICO